ncbi:MULTISPECIES: hypothetical protein [Niastella]|uniref:Biopolymer transporter ExbD n=1 Tax=Niastella soli TaxID=2821487 RepID=A0ABS3Z071_9BACT|nr:hypothetical protein [Niastella soli]MBO9203572.1 hypothetical protein [Niastella soli]
MKRPKLFYIPGIISLLVIPVLFYYIFSLPVINRQPEIRFFIPKEEWVRPYLKKKKINTVYLDDNHSFNDEKLAFIGQEAQKLMFYHDTTQVIKVVFSDKSTYGEFIQLINLMQKNSIKRYVLLNNGFYIFGDPPPEPPEENSYKHLTL